MVDATCPAGTQVLGGGYSLQDVTQALGAPGGTGSIAADGVVVTYSAPSGGSSWRVILVNVDGASHLTRANATALCA